MIESDWQKLDRIRDFLIGERDSQEQSGNAQNAGEIDCLVDDLSDVMEGLS